MENIWFHIDRVIFRADRWKLFLQGLGVTLEITIAAIIIGTILGILIVAMRLSKKKLLTIPASVYVNVIRGTPMVTQLLIMYFVVFASVPGVSRTVVAIIAFGLNSGAYISEILRAGILAVDKGQTEAGRSLGLSSTKCMTFIVMPQAVKNILPTYANEFIVLVKETAIVGYIGIQDLTKMADGIRSNTYDPFVALLFAALLYLIITSILSFVFGKIERRLRESDIR